MMSAATSLRVVIVAENASTAFGGEAILPWHYFRLLYRRGVDVHLVAHERTKRELEHLLPEAKGRMHFLPDLPVQRWLHRLGERLPARIAENSTGLGVQFASAWSQRKLVRRLIVEHGIQVVHEPIPVSPKRPSFMHGLGAPVVIGPMNGGMDYPPAFAREKGLIERTFIRGARELSHYVNALIPGKRQAALLLVANRRTLRDMWSPWSKTVWTSRCSRAQDRCPWRRARGPASPSWGVWSTGSGWTC
jgi:hypothetical protein